MDSLSLGVVIGEFLRVAGRRVPWGALPVPWVVTVGIVSGGYRVGWGPVARVA